MRCLRLVFCAVLLVMTSLAHVPARAEEQEERYEKAEDVRARLEARRARRVGAEGELKPGALIEARRQLESRPQPLTTLGTQDAGIWSWEWLGPGNIGGRVRDILIHPANPNMMWAGTAGGGIWRTLNGGNSWLPMSDFMPSLPVSTLALDPIVQTTLYAGTGERVGSNSSIPGAGIYKSTNSGLNWFQLPFTNSPDFEHVSRIAHHPVISGRLLAGTRTGLWYTNDGGAYWTNIFAPPNGAAVRDVKYNPSNYGIIAVGTETDMYLSTDGGASFVPQTTGATNKMPASPGDCAIAFAPTNTNIIFVSAGKDDDDGNDLTDAIYKSSNSGGKWSFFRPTNADRWSNALWVSPTDSSLLVWGGFGDLYRTLGQSGFGQISDWRYYNQGQSAHGDQHVVVAQPNYNDSDPSKRTVFVGNDGGVQKISDVWTVTTTSGWTNLANNLGVSQFFGGAASPTGSVIVGGMQDMGSAVYHPGGGSQGWTYTDWDPGSPLDSGGDGIYAAVDYNNPQRLFVSSQFGWVGRSDDGGANVTPKVSGLFGPGQKNEFDFLAPLVMDPNNSSVLALGGIVIWRTSNGGDSWTRMRDSIPGNPRCMAIDISKSNSNVVWVGYSNGLVSHTENANAANPTWIDHTIPFTPSPGPPPRMVTDIAINPFVWSEVVVTISGYSTDTVWLTSTNGASWQRRTGAPPYDLPDIQVNTVRYHPLQPNWIYIGTDMGVFASEDKGLNWGITPASAGNEGPNNVEVDELFWQGTTYLLAATHGRGIYRSKPLEIVYVDRNYVGFEDGTQFFPYNTVAEAVAAYGPGAMISVKGATYPEPPLVISKRGTVISTNGATRIE